MKIWMENKAKIEKHNRLAHKGHKSYHMAMNQFGDMLHHEFTALMNGYQSRSKFNYTGTNVPQRGAQFLPPAHVTSLPENVDWREHGVDSVTVSLFANNYYFTPDLTNRETVAATL